MRIRVFVGLLTAVSAALAEEKPRGSQPSMEIVHFWNNECATCHGQKGEGIEEAKAPALAGLPDYYILDQIAEFRRGLRKGADDTGSGFVAEMHREAVELDDALFKQLAVHIAALPVQRPKRTVSGDPEAGRQPYQELCGGCHGSAAQGDPVKRTPPLHAFQDWYLVEQIRRFRSGLRRPDPAHAESLQMHAMALRFPSLDEARDLALHINAFLPGQPDAEP
ncbi:MAG: cytochrome c oxidase subunit 2 [Verrucomicrobia bacterium]|nr:MAG: cytochrome c oxidase subunit 2 [Verrucomicrobiota bacterium]